MTYRASFQKHDMNMKCGKPAMRKPVVATYKELEAMGKAVASIEAAERATDETAMLAALSETYRNIRKIIQSRTIKN